MSPVFGEFSARAKVAAACNLAGLDIDTLTREQKDQFVDKLRLTCQKALGEKATADVIAKVKTF